MTIRRGDRNFKLESGARRLTPLDPLLQPETGNWKLETRNSKLKTVLIAEDEPSIVLSLEFLLKGAGYEVLVARTGSEALALIDQARPDLVVLDIMLPVVNGLEVCRSVRASAALRHTHILMLTARGRESEVERGLGLGADAYMTKPFATRELVRTVQQLLGDEVMR